MSHRIEAWLDKSIALGSSALTVALVLALTDVAHAEGMDASLDSESVDPAGGDGRFILAGKVGGIASFNGLDPFVIGGLELGYAFGDSRQFTGYVVAEFTAPTAEGEQTEDFDPERVPGGEYSWELRQKQLVFQPTFAYRFTTLSPSITPYAGIGPRIYLLESVTRGESGGETFRDTTEQSTKFGVGVPLGAELQLGPGGLLGELLFQYAPLDHVATGKTNLMSLSLFLGYRAML